MIIWLCDRISQTLRYCVNELRVVDRFALRVQYWRLYCLYRPLISCWGVRNLSQSFHSISWLLVRIFTVFIKFAHCSITTSQLWKGWLRASWPRGEPRTPSYKGGLNPSKIITGSAAHKLKKNLILKNF